jgi:hypothetical protein
VVVTVVAAMTLSSSPISSASAAAPSTPTVTSAQTLTPPNPAATNFGSTGYSLDESRAVVAATVGATRVVYVFDLQPNGTWSNTATIPAPAGSTTYWGQSLAVSANTVAVTDPADEGATGGSGRLDVFDRVGGAWSRVQVLRIDEPFRTFATAGVWLAGDGMVVQEWGYCDSFCYFGKWFIYERNASNQFAQTVAPRSPGYGMRAGVDAGRFAVATPCVPEYQAELTVLNTATSPASVALRDSLPCTGSLDEVQRVDVAAGVLVTETCCADTTELDVRRQTATGYVPEAKIPISRPSDGLVVVRGVILRADAAAKVLHSHIPVNGQWVPGLDIPLPADADVAGIVAARRLVAFRGANRVYIWSIADLPVVVPGVGSVTEGNSGSKTLSVPVTLSHEFGDPVTVKWETVDSLTQPTAGVDYAPASGTVTFAPGQTTATASFTVYGDTIDENTLWNAEWGAVRFHSPTNATIGPDFDAIGFALIFDDDPPPTIVTSTASVREGNVGDTTLPVKVGLSTPSGQTVTVHWATRDSAAQPKAGVDYAPGSGTITFAPGETSRTVPFVVHGDTVDEPGEGYDAEWGGIQLSAPTNAVFGTGPLAQISLALIVDDD